MFKPSNRSLRALISGPRPAPLAPSGLGRGRYLNTGRRKPPRRSREPQPFGETHRFKGYSLVELMVAMALALMILGMAFTFFNDMYNTADLADNIADVNENLRATVNVISTDLMTSGTEIAVGGIPIPSGGTATPINRPGPPGAGTFPATGAIPVVSPGPGLGPNCCGPTGTIPTDLITLISINQLSNLDQYPLTNITTSVTAATITVALPVPGPGTNINPAGPPTPNPSAVVPGQLIMLTNVNGSCLLTVTAVNYTTNIITFTHTDPNDTFGLNQFSGPTSGTINQLKTGGTFPSTSAYHVSMVTYYLDNSTTPYRLMKQYLFKTAANPPQPVALDINVLQFSYSLYPACDTPSDPCRSITDYPSQGPNNIRKVNIWAIGQADHPNRKTGRYFSNSIATSVTIQNLAYYNKY